MTHCFKVRKRKKPSGLAVPWSVSPKAIMSALHSLKLTIHEQHNGYVRSAERKAEPQRTPGTDPGVLALLLHARRTNLGKECVR